MTIMLDVRGQFYRDGNKVFALIDNCADVGYAICSSNDEFDLDYGIRLSALRGLSERGYDSYPNFAYMQYLGVYKIRIGLDVILEFVGRCDGANTMCAAQGWDRRYWQIAEEVMSHSWIWIHKEE